MIRTGKWNDFFSKLAGLVVIACLLSAGSVSADSSTRVSLDNEVNSESAKPVFLVGFAQDTLANDWRAQQVREVEQVLAAHPSVKFIVKDGKGETAQQIMDIEDLIAQGVDVLITSPRDAKALTPVISDAYRQGIPVVLLGRRIEGDDFTVFISADNKEIARKAAQFLGKKHPVGGRILMLKGLCKVTSTIHRTNTFVKELAKFEQLKIVADVSANYLRGDAIKVVHDVLEAGIQFDIIYAQSDGMATGARMALEYAGIDPKKISIVGIDYIQEARTAIRSGEQDVSFTYPTGGKQGAEQVLKILKGEAVPKNITIESEMVTIENVEKIKPIF